MDAPGRGSERSASTPEAPTKDERRRHFVMTDPSTPAFPRDTGKVELESADIRSEFGASSKLDSHPDREFCLAGILTITSLTTQLVPAMKQPLDWFDSAFSHLDIERHRAPPVSNVEARCDWGSGKSNRSCNTCAFARRTSIHPCRRGAKEHSPGGRVLGCGRSRLGSCNLNGVVGSLVEVGIHNDVKTFANFNGPCDFHGRLGDSGPATSLRKQEIGLINGVVVFADMRKMVGERL